MADKLCNHDEIYKKELINCLKAEFLSVYLDSNKIFTLNQYLLIKQISLSYSVIIGNLRSIYM